MLVFCPECGTLLMLEVGEYGNEFKCHKCSYYLPIASERRPVIISRLWCKPREVRGAEVAQVEAETTEVTCPECFNDKAYFAQVQTRSADEPMSIFYTCIKCQHRWKE